VKVGLVDYDAGNLRSVELALDHLGAKYVVSQDPKDLADLDRLIFPGVGEARSAMDVLKAKNLDVMIQEFAASGKPLLGICLGCQILMTLSEERETGCLDIFPGKVRKFPKGTGLKIPHMGWNQVWHKGRHRIFDGIPDGVSFYFVHSYYVECGEEDLEICTTDYGLDFTSGIARKNVIAFQFHPEKSGEYGLKLLDNFLQMEDF
jgi:imidazole glycerol-phosphate synthase subunit HisH